MVLTKVASSRTSLNGYSKITSRRSRKVPSRSRKAKQQRTTRTKTLLDFGSSNPRHHNPYSLLQPATLPPHLDSNWRSHESADDRRRVTCRVGNRVAVRPHSSQREQRD